MGSLRPGPLRTLVCSALAPLLWQCGGEEPELSLGVAQHLALGSEVNVHVSARCQRPCDAERGTSVVESASVSDPTIIDVQRSGDRFVLRTLREGTVELRVSGRSPDGSVRKDFAETVHVARPDRVTIEPPHECSLPIVFGTGAQFAIRTELFQGATRLWGEPRPFPLASDVVVWDPNGATLGGRLEVTAGPTRGAGTIRSAVSEDALAIEVVDIDQVAAVRAEGMDTRRELFRGARVSLETKVNVGGREPCKEAFPRHVTVDTPETCAAQPGTKPKEIAIHALSAGKCIVNVSVGANAREVLEIGVRGDR